MPLPFANGRSGWTARVEVSLPMNYEHAVSRLYELGHELARIPAQKFDIAHMRELAHALGNPQNSFSSVLIAGTNGKGSTAATLASILRAAGYRTGLYTSPHLVRINERIRINGAAIADEDFTHAYARVGLVAQELVDGGRLPWMPSFFETMTAMAFEYFAHAGVQIAVLEVGMGGRLDATNIVDPLISIITDIDLDHQKYLGDTIAEIAREKAGILRKDRIAVTLPQHPQANDVIGRTMIEIGAQAVNASRNVPPVSPGAGDLVKTEHGRTRYRLSVLGEEIEIDSALTGRHQLRNLALAITAAEELNQCGFAVTARQIATGIREASWSGRFQVLPASGDHPEIVLDVAHNPAGAWALRSALTDRYGERPRVVVFGAMRDKAIRDIAQILFPTATKVIATTTDHTPRAASTEEIATIANTVGIEVDRAEIVSLAVDAAVACAREMKSSEGEPIVVITGSIYIVGSAMEALGVTP